MTATQHFYIESFKSIQLNTYRYDHSPFAHHYVTEETIFGMYCNRFYPLKIAGDEDPTAQYWRLREGVLLYDVPEKPLEIVGPDAAELLEKVLTCRVRKMKVGRARYGLACNEDGTVLMDGVLMRLDKERFWYVKANGEFMSWLKAHAIGLDVIVRDPNSRVLQIQGPKALHVLDAATGGEMTADFKYFQARWFNIGGQRLWVSRTGWTGEAGIEIYSNSGPEPTDHDALWHHLFSCGEPYGIAFSSASSMGIRRIEAGILDNGSDIEPDLTPFGAGLASFVNFRKDDFIGRAVLETADRSQLLFGLICPTATPESDMRLFKDGRAVGHMTIGTWSPTLNSGIGYARFDAPCEGESWLGKVVQLEDDAGQLHEARIDSLPFIDKEKQLPKIAWEVDG